MKNGTLFLEFETIPYPETLLRQCNNSILQEELDSDRQSLEAEHTKLLNGLNFEEKKIYDAIIDSVIGNKDGFFFVCGHGGIGKTYLWKTLTFRLRSERKIVITVVLSGIATLLSLGGRTAHLRSQIPINVIDSLTCRFKQGSQAAKLL